jgi:hypothetical protein
MSLRDLQTAFMHAVFAQDVADVASYTDSLNSDRLSIYTNNVYAALTKALQAIYPVIERLVDEKFFRFAARHYIDQYPSTSGDLNQYGEHFATFLSEFPPVASLAYLPDVARLELYCHQAYLAANDAPLDLQRLATVPQQDHGKLCFRINSSARLLRSAWPIDTIWRVNQSDYHGDQSVNLAEGGVRLLIQRRDDKIALLPLNEVEWNFSSHIAENNTLEMACERALRENPDADIVALLQKFVAQATLVDFSF